MPETKEAIERRAKKEGFEKSSITKGEKGYFLAPHGIMEKGAKEAYSKCRSDGGDAEKCAKIAWSIQKKIKSKNNDSLKEIKKLCEQINLLIK